MPKKRHPLLMALRRRADGLRLKMRFLLAPVQGREVVRFIHIGKTGGTAVKAALGREFTTERYFVRLEAHQVRLVDVPRGHRVIFVVRDPVKRFKSAFYSRLRQGQPRYFKAWSPEERRAFERFPSANAIAAGLRSTDGGEQLAAEAAMRDIFHVRHTYAYWFRDADYLESRRDDILWIGFQESLASDFEAIKTLLGVDPACTLPTDEVSAHRTPLSLAEDLSPEAAAVIRDWYAQDYAFMDRFREIAAERRAALDSRSP